MNKTRTHTISPSPPSPQWETKGIRQSHQVLAVGEEGQPRTAPARRREADGRGEGRAGREFTGGATTLGHGARNRYLFISISDCKEMLIWLKRKKKLTIAKHEPLLFRSGIGPVARGYPPEQPEYQLQNRPKSLPTIVENGRYLVTRGLVGCCVPLSYRLRTS